MEGKSLMRERRWPEAILIFREDVKERPEDPWTPMFLGSCYYELEEFDGALQWFKHAEWLSPENATAIGLQGDALHCLGELDAARECYRRALELAPESELAIENWKRFNKLEG